MTDLHDDLPRRVLGGSPDAILICDRGGTVRYWNRSAHWEAAMKTGVTRYGEGQLLAIPALHLQGRSAEESRCSGPVERS